MFCWLCCCCLGFGGVAEAQECVAGATSANVRAEGETEKVGVITVRCRGPKQRDQDDALTLGGGAVTKLAIAVTLNTDITNDRDSSDKIARTTTTQAEAADYDAYRDGNVMLAGFQLDTNQGGNDHRDL